MIKRYAVSKKFLSKYFVSGFATGKLFMSFIISVSNTLTVSVNGLANGIKSFVKRISVDGASGVDTNDCVYTQCNDNLN